LFDVVMVMVGGGSKGTTGMDGYIRGRGWGNGGKNQSLSIEPKGKKIASHLLFHYCKCQLKTRC
jgi:hypothetical protein